MSRVREIDNKNRTHCFLDDITNIKDLDANKIKIDEKSYKNTPIYYVGYVTSNSVKPLYLANEYIEKNGIKCLTLIPTNKSKDTLKNYEKKIIRSKLIQVSCKRYEIQIQFR